VRILVVEDDADLADALVRDLRAAGYAVDSVGTAREAHDQVSVEPVDAVILDLGLPDGSGLVLLQRWREAGNGLPVLVLTARDAWHERVDGFKAGADDYVGKPFHTEELLARLAALLRRAHGRAAGPLCVGGLSLDEERQTVTVGDGRTASLTATEFRLLRYFMLNTDRILSKDRLIEHVYAGDEDPDSNVLEVYVNRLRRKIGPERIATRRGQGYIFRAAGGGGGDG
jgi:DNA-binding response OmpR family regulator